MSFRIHNGRLLIVGNTLATNDECCCWFFCCKKYEESEEGPVLVGRACSPEPCPEGWIQESYHPTPGGCGISCCCPMPNTWRIVDSQSRIYAQGPMVNCSPLDYPTSPCTFPQYYWPSASGPSWSETLRLQVSGCGGGFQTIATDTFNWETCGGDCSTYGLPDPPHPPGSFAGPRWLYTAGFGLFPFFGFTLPMPEQCECEPATQESPPSPLNPCSNPCTQESFFIINFSLPGTGQAWRSLLYGPAVRFTGAADGEWTNLANWQDANGQSPAYSLPTSTSNVTIAGNVTSVTIFPSVTVKTLTILPGASLAIEISCEDLVCRGTIARPTSPVCAYTYGKVSYLNSATFISGVLDGELVQTPAASDAAFTMDSVINSQGYLNGSGVFSGTSVNAGFVSGSATFNGSSSNPGVVDAGSGSVVFNGSSYNSGFIIGTSYTSTFNDNSENLGDGGLNPTFNDSATNTSTGYAGNATFNDTSRNYGNIVSTATFNDSSCNSGTAGTIVGSPPSC